MRGFIILCLVAVACADQLGYNYKPVGHSSNNIPSFSGLQGGASLLGAGSQGISNFGAGSSFSGSQGISNFGASSNVAPSFSGSQGLFNYGSSSNYAPSFSGSQGLSNFAAGPSGHQGNLGQVSHDNAAYAPQAELEKEFITYTANEDDFNEPAAANQVQNTFKQGLRVIFIKGPENKGLENAALSLAKHASEQKTAIYVLQKQADISGLSNKLNAENSNVQNKPEVHFVKYRTAEDAINAQKAIQQQYDSLGGTSQSHDGGVAPVLNFASQAPAASHGSDGSHGAGSLGAGSLGAGSLGAGSLGAGSLNAGSLGAGSLGAGSLGAGSLGLGSLASGSLGSGSLGSGSVGIGSISGGSNVGSSYIPPAAASGISTPGESYLPATRL